MIDREREREWGREREVVSETATGLANLFPVNDSDVSGCSSTALIVDLYQNLTHLSLFETSHKRRIRTNQHHVSRIIVAMAPGNDVEVVGVSWRGPFEESSC